MAVTQSLTLEFHDDGNQFTTNKSEVRMIWTSTQTGDSWNGYTKTARYYVSFNGGAEVEYSVTYTLPQNKTATIVDTWLYVPHLDDGTASVRVRTWMDTGISAGVVEKTKSLTLPTIPKASTITSVSNVYLGAKCSVKWTPLSKNFRYRLKFSMGNWEHTTDAIHPNQTTSYLYTGYTIPLDAANQIPNSPTGTMTVSLYSYSDSYGYSPIGEESTKTFTVTVPDNADTKPIATVEFSPVHTLGDSFAGLFLQGISKVKASISAEGKYGASVKSKSITVGGIEFGSSKDYTSDPVPEYGNVTVNVNLTDSRGYTNSIAHTISVIPYTKPRVVPVSTEASVACGRCDENGEWSDSGTYLKIKARRSYSLCMVDGVQKNFCGLRYRYKNVDSEKYSEWFNLLLATDLSNEEVITNPLLEGSLSIEESYIVQVDAVDIIPYNTPTTFTIPTDKVYLHRAGSKRSLGIGKYAEGYNLVDIAEDITTKFRGKVDFAGEEWVSLGLSDNVDDSDHNSRYGRHEGTGCYYRVCAGDKHIYVSFNCMFTYNGTALQINKDPIPEDIRPQRKVFAICATGGRAIARIYVNTDGNIIVDWIQKIATSEETTAIEVYWIDGYIDYWV